MTDPVVFNDRDPGPEIRRKLNLMGADFAYAVDNAVGPNAATMDAALSEARINLISTQASLIGTQAIIAQHHAFA